MLKPNIVLIVQDSARANNFSLYGYQNHTNSYLERIAEHCVLYMNAISPATSTIPAHASIFTGTHLSTHRLFIDGDILSSKFLTLAEVLREQGYITYGICYQDDVSPATGLHRGFHEFCTDDEPNLIKKIVRSTIGTRPFKHAEVEKPNNQREKRSKVHRRDTFLTRVKNSDLYQGLYWFSTRNSDQGADSSNKKIHRFLSSIDRNTPFFIYLHYDETHLVYRPPVPYRYKFFDRNGYRKKPWLINQDRHKYFLKEVEMSDEDFEILRALYDGAISYLDKKTYDLYQLLYSSRLLDNTLFIVVGDHGDNIGEHSLISHKYCLYDTIIRVPMLIKYPKAMGTWGRSEKIVQLTDILPTVLDMLDVSDHRILEQIEGNSLISSRIENRNGDYAVSELMKPFGADIFREKEKLKQYDRRMLSIRTMKTKYIWTSDEKDEFYDLARDPDENENLIDNTDVIKLGNLKEIARKHLINFEKCYEAYKGVLS